MDIMEYRSRSPKLLCGYGGKGALEMRVLGVQNLKSKSRAADGGSGEAQFHMGVHLLNGVGIEKVV